METIVFVGVGAMAEAMISGIVERGTVLPHNIHIMNRSDEDRLLFMKEKYGVSIVCHEKAVLKNADLVILAMKPKDVHDGMAGILPYVKADTAILSVIAGIPIATIEKGLGGQRPIARSMPNTSATIGKSATAVSWNQKVTASTKNLVLELLSSIGMVQEVEEDELHIVTALSGSGPAYIYYVAEALEEVAIEKGLSQEVSRALIIQTLEGAAAMLRKTDKEPAELRKNVTSPGGTTEAGISALDEHSFKLIMAACVKAAEIKSRELGSMS